MQKPDNAPAKAKNNSAAAGVVRTLTVYSRVGCHLCDEMVYALRARQPLHGFQIDIIDVDSSAVFKEQHGLRVPVLMSGIKEICWGRLDDDLLQAWLSEQR